MAPKIRGSAGEVAVPISARLLALERQQARILARVDVVALRRSVVMPWRRRAVTAGIAGMDHHVHYVRI